MNLRRHWRFLLGTALGVGAVALVRGDTLQRLLAGADVLFGFYLVSTWLVMRGVTPAILRAHAREDDEGAAVIFVIALAAATISLLAVFSALSGGEVGRARIFGALASVPLGWATLHTLFALRYAHLWYVPGDETVPDSEVAPPQVGGLDFGSRTTEPGLIEFLYYSFTIGMTAQTSDVDVTTSEMRRLTLWHGAISFLYNTVLIALAVNAGITAAGGAGG